MNNKGSKHLPFFYQKTPKSMPARLFNFNLYPSLQFLF